MSELVVFVSIVTFNSAKFIEKAISSLLEQRDLKVGESLTIQVTDNASSDKSVDLVQQRFGSSVKVTENKQNLGFAAGHNAALKNFLESNATHFFLLNPDLTLAPDALIKLASKTNSAGRIGITTPKLLRADETLKPTEPPRIDAAGMVITNSLRHFDRGSEELDLGQYEREELVFGGTGAALMLSRECVVDLLYQPSEREDLLIVVSAHLPGDIKSRALLFDEAFFAYREDAELAWRANWQGWSCCYVPSALGFHLRRVLPDNRFELPAEVNLHGVRNRFLLQLLHFSLKANWKAIIPGIVFRNLLVVLGVLVRERSSLRAFYQLLKLLPRTLALRRYFIRKRIADPSTIAEFFQL